MMLAAGMDYPQGDLRCSAANQDMQRSDICLVAKGAATRNEVLRFQTRFDLLVWIY